MAGFAPTPQEVRAYQYIEMRIKRRLSAEDKLVLHGNIEPGSWDEFSDTVELWVEHGLPFEGAKMVEFRTSYLNRVAERREREWQQEKAQYNHTRIIDALNGTAGA